MDMPIKQLTPMSQIEEYTEEQIQRIERALLRNLMYCGELCLTKARSTKSYKDQTGNLRSSLGYVISVDGRIVKASNFNAVKTGQEGSKKGVAYAKRIARQFPKGMCLIVVAGMNYASYVSAKGFDVLDSSELLAERIVPKLLNQLGFK